MNTHRNHQAGDTIVEVVIAMAVIATILVGAFIATNRNTLTVRDTEEHAEALQLLQGQVEYVRHAAAVRSSLPNTLTTPFCLDATASYQPAVIDSHCLVHALYRVAITSATATPNVGTTTTFNLTATWPALRGGTNIVYLAYKVVVAP